jgi:SAM-dependent methyltransferase
VTVRCMCRQQCVDSRVYGGWIAARKHRVGQGWALIRLIRLSSTALANEQRSDADDGVHFASAMVRTILEEFSAPGERVLDPFAGFGTTLVVAEEMGRVPVGLELLPERVAQIRNRVRPGVRVIEGDAQRLSRYEIGPIDLCLTSPPYMTALGHPENPLTGYRTLDGDYQAYVAALGEVFHAVAELLRPGGYLVINVANVWGADSVTPLAWDIGSAVAARLPFHGEIYLDWDPPLEYLSGDYCLVFRKPVSI